MIQLIDSWKPYTHPMTIAIILTPTESNRHLMRDRFLVTCAMQSTYTTSKNAEDLITVWSRLCSRTMKRPKRNSFPRTQYFDLSKHFAVGHENSFIKWSTLSTYEQNNAHLADGGRVSAYNVNLMWRRNFYGFKSIALFFRKTNVSGEYENLAIIAIRAQKKSWCNFFRRQFGV